MRSLVQQLVCHLTEWIGLPFVRGHLAVKGLPGLEDHFSPGAGLHYYALGQSRPHIAWFNPMLFMVRSLPPDFTKQKDKRTPI